MGGDNHARWLQHRDATDQTNAVMDPNGEPAAVNCRQRHVRTIAEPRFRWSEARSEGLEPPTF